VILVEVEGVGFNIWVVEERTRERSGVVLGEGVEDDGSKVVPSEFSGEVEEGYGGGAENSGEDEVSGQESDSDTSMQQQHGGSYEVGRCNPMRSGEAKGGNENLTCQKSTKSPDSKMETNICVPTSGCCEVLVNGQGKKLSAEVVSTKVGVSDMCLQGGTESPGVRESDCDLIYPVGVGVGQSGCLSDPLLADPYVLGLNDPCPAPFGPFAGDGETRLSSISEPEEVFHPHRSKAPKHTSKSKRSTSFNKSHQLGIPKCVQFLEAVQVGNSRNHRRRVKSNAAMDAVFEADGVISPSSTSQQLDVDVGEQAINPIQEEDGSVPILTPVVTPPSGLNLISSSDNSLVRDTPPVESDADRLQKLEAANLLAIQKGVGFSFAVEDGVTVTNLIQQELCDRAKKMEWEQSNGDQ
jgi:hypothetical protein